MSEGVVDVVSRSTVEAALVFTLVAIVVVGFLAYLLGVQNSPIQPGQVFDSLGNQMGGHVLQRLNSPAP